jgi:hypothetical protein
VEKYSFKLERSIENEDKLIDEEGKNELDDEINGKTWDIMILLISGGEGLEKYFG